VHFVKVFEQTENTEALRRGFYSSVAKLQAYKNSAKNIQKFTVRPKRREVVAPSPLPLNTPLVMSLPDDKQCIRWIAVPYYTAYSVAALRCSPRRPPVAGGKVGVWGGSYYLLYLYKKAIYCTSCNEFNGAIFNHLAWPWSEIFAPLLEFWLISTSFCTTFPSNHRLHRRTLITLIAGVCLQHLVDRWSRTDCSFFRKHIAAQLFYRSDNILVVPFLACYTFKLCLCKFPSHHVRCVSFSFYIISNFTFLNDHNYREGPDFLTNFPSAK